MSVRWKTIARRLHPQSALHDRRNRVSEIFDETIGEPLDEYNQYLDDTTLNYYILTAEGVYLDIIGLDFGLTRKNDETDTSYRQRILNNIDQKLTTTYCKRRGIYLWSIKGINSDIRTQLSSMNTYNSAQYVAVPKTRESYNFVKKQMIYNQIIQLYQKGWE